MSETADHPDPQEARRLAMLLDQLRALIAKLSAETEGYLDRQDDPQLWYNRGYANGMVAALGAAGFGGQAAVDDPYETARDQGHLPWGKAYEHGRGNGWKETCEVLQVTDPIQGA
jgi:hypothetical protein